MVENFDIGEDAKEIISRGTWIDKLALKVVDRKDNLKGKLPSIIKFKKNL